MFDFFKRFSYRQYLLGLFLLIIVAILVVAYFLDFRKPMNWGVTFSWPYVEQELKLEPKEVYLAILDDLGADRIRLSAYWDEIEKQKGEYDFSNLDWQVSEAKKREVKIILAVGRRLPRWPECHDPAWLKETNSIEVEQRLLKFIEAIMKRYDAYDNIIYWQIENEPYLSTFGICPPPDEELLKSEISLAKQLTSKSILVTDSGELSTWLPISRSGGDVLGTTLYRVVYNPMFGYFRWFTPPSFYWVRAELIKKISPLKKVIVAELQAESWHKENQTLATMTLAEHNESLSIEQFKNNLEFTRRAGFDEAYLWGAEWWYLMKVKNNYPDYWLEAKKLWKD